jgi:hypothetical protein
VRPKTCSLAADSSSDSSESSSDEGMSEDFSPVGKKLCWDSADSDSDDSDSQGQAGYESDEDELGFDPIALEDNMNDTTQKTQRHAPRVAPEVFFFVPRPSEMPCTSSILKSKVLWFVPACMDGNPGWVTSEIVAGAPDPLSAASGVTMVLKTTRRMDVNAPAWLIRDQFGAHFSLANYTEAWYLLKAD